MGYTTRELAATTGLSKLYPSHYVETQVHNWTPVDIVITRHDGRQIELPKWPKSSACQAPFVEIQTREVTGMRIEDRRGHQVDVAVPVKSYMVTYDEFLLYPVKIDELGYIVSTKEHALVAKDMLQASRYSPEANESLSDFETLDPRFVFEVMDPLNQWETLFANILGQTIQISCGHSNHMIPDLDEEAVKTYSDQCKLSCYLRYPSNSIQYDRPVVPVFSINLKDLELEEPYLLPSGDVICVASSEEALQRVIQKKHSGSQHSVQIAGMVSKDIHDQTVKELKSQLEKIKESNIEQLRSLRVCKDAELAELKAKLDEEKRKNAAQLKQIELWDSLHETSTEWSSREEKLSLAREKYRQEIAENSRKETEAVWDALKIGGAAAAGIITFALGLYVKTHKK